MSRLFQLTLLLVLFQSSAAVAGEPQFADRYRSLLMNPTSDTAPYREFRDAYVLSATYDPESERIADANSRMIDEIQKDKFAKAKSFAEKVLAIDPTNTSAHWVMHLSYKGLKDEKMASLHEQMYDGIYRSILESGEIGNIKKPLHIVTRHEMYNTVDYLGGAVTNVVSTIDGCNGNVDLVYAQEKSTGREGMFFFEVNALTNHKASAAKSTSPQPYKPTHPTPPAAEASPSAPGDCRR